MEELRFRILGPVGVRRAGAEIPLRARRLRTLLIALLIQPHRVVPTAELVEALWGADLPAGPERALQTAVSRLRAALGPAASVIRTVPGGYLIAVEPEQLDLAEFRALVDSAAAEEKLLPKAKMLDEALALWRDVPLSGTGVEALEGRPWLIEERLQAIERLIDVRLALGEHSALLAELAKLTQQYPLRERFWIQHMIALYRAGRQADALAAYRRLETRLAEELGVDPGAETREVRQAILAGEALAAGSAGQGGARTDEADPGPDDDPGEAWREHRQLPMDLADFVGREEAIGQLTERLSQDAALPVMVVSGPPGVGKSALAVHVAHRLRDRFPDGQWHVRLAGASAAPRDPAEVLGELLGLAGIDPYAVPADLEARAALLRSTLADRRVLIVLDDARDAGQVRPLLPGTAGNAVLVTSRNELTALMVTVGARTTRLGMLGEHEAADLLSCMLGAERVAAERQAAADLAEVCGRLPLALRIAAGHLVSYPDQPIAQYVELLRTGDRLEELAIGDGPDTAVAAAFALSYESLPRPARRLFALLGVLPCGDFTAPVAAALLDCPSPDAGRLLDLLVGVNLLQRQHSRYGMHDLIRLYAVRRAEGEPGAEQAWTRVVDWYLRTADAAVDFRYRGYVQLTGRLFDENPFDRAQQADAWLAAELPNLVECVMAAAECGPYEQAWRLVDVLRHYFNTDDLVGAWRPAAAAGLRAALASGDRAGEGAMRHSLGVLLAATGDNLASIEQLTAASECYAEVGFRLGEAALLCNLGMAHDDLGESTRAAELLQRGIAIFRALGRGSSLAPALHSLSNVRWNLGELDAALAAANEALQIEPAGRPGSIALLNRATIRRLQGEAELAERDFAAAIALSERTPVAAYYEFGLLLADLGRYDEAEAQARRSLEISRRDGLEWHEASALNVLGIACRGKGQWDEAVRHHSAARDIAVRLGHRATEAEALLGLAGVALARRQLADALELGRQARGLASELQQRIVQCRALLLLAETSRLAGHSDDANRYAAEAADLQQSTGYRPIAPAGVCLP